MKPNANCGEGAFGCPPDAKADSTTGDQYKKLKDKFTKVTAAQPCDVIVYFFDKEATHFAIVVDVDANGKPTAVIGQTTHSNLKLSGPFGQEGETSEKTTPVEYWRPNAAVDKPLPDKVKKAQDDAKKADPKKDAEKKDGGVWYKYWKICHDRNVAAFEGRPISSLIRTPSQAANAPQYVVAPPTTTDGGLYAGVEGGARITGGSSVTTTGTTTLNGADNVLEPRSNFNGAGPAGGVYIGYTSPFSSNFVAQVELGGGYGNTDKTQAGIPGTAGIPVPGITARIPNDSTTVKTTWDLHVLGRLGTKITPSTTLFVTGGGGLLHAETTVNCTAAGVCGGIGVPPFSATNAATRAGWILGGAIETAVTRSLKARLEYRHGDYGTHSAVYGNPAQLAVNASTKLVTDQVMVGLSYRFGAPPAPPSPARAPYSGPPMVVKAPALK